jgi:hypothetical protein
MSSVAKLLIGVSALCFAIAVIIALLGVTLIGVPAEGFSRACSNAALISIALSVGSGGKAAAN